MREDSPQISCLYRPFKIFRYQKLIKRTTSFHGEKLPSVSLLEKYFLEVSFGVYVGKKGLEFGGDGSAAPERTYLTFLDLFL